MTLRPSAQPLGRAGPPGQDRPIVEETPEVIGELAGRGVAMLGLLRHRLADDRFQVTRDRRLEPSRGDGLEARDPTNQILAIDAFESRPGGQQLV